MKMHDAFAIYCRALLVVGLLGASQRALFSQEPETAVSESAEGDPNAPPLPEPEPESAPLVQPQAAPDLGPKVSPAKPKAAPKGTTNPSTAPPKAAPSGEAPRAITVALAGVPQMLDNRPQGASEIAQYERGDLIEFNLATTGDVQAVKWKIEPVEVRTSLKLINGGRKAYFANRNVGPYRITCAVSGPAGIEITVHEFEIVDSMQAAARPEPSPMERVQQQRPQQRGDSDPSIDVQRVPTWPEVGAVAFSSVKSPTRLAEAKIVAGCLRTVANRIQTGTFTGNDPIEEAHRQANVALGNASPRWLNFFKNIRAASSNVSGVAYVPVFEALASTLSSAQ